MDESSNTLGEAEKRVGATLRGKYTIDKVLGVGGMAAVYRAVHRNGHRVALKMLHTSISSNADLRGRFLREGYVANTVDHPGAVRVTDDDVAEDGSVFLVMELLEGETVDALFERSGPLPPRDVATIAWHLLDVLEAAHAKGVVHRDIKPDNLFITRAGVLKILDFGIARLVDSLTSATATQTGSMVGTPAFMAPEQALGRSREIDARTDLWSVGATLFLLGSGQYVHEADTVGAMVVYAGSKQARTMSSVAPDFPAPLAAVVDRALAFEKGQRYPGAGAMKRAIEEAFAACFGSPVPTGPMSTSAAMAPRASLADASGAFGPTMQSGQAPVPSGSTPEARGRTAASTAGVASTGAPKARGTPVAAIAIGVAVALAGAFGLGAFAKRSPGPPAMTTATGAGPTAASSPVPMAPSAVVTLATTDVASAAASAEGPARAATKTLEPKPPLAVPAVAQPVHGGATRPAGAKPIAPAAATAAPAPAAPHVDCEPPYSIDAQGHRIPKPGCY